MIPIQQSRFYIPDKQGGNCWISCVASILEIQLKDCPDVPLGPSWLPKDHDKVKDWLAGYGLVYLCVSGNETFINHTDGAESLYWIASGVACRNVRHSVVMLGSKMVHDPHPSRRGLISIDTLGFLLSCDPSKPWHKVKR